MESLKPGQGLFQAGLFAKGDLEDGTVGAFADYERRLTRRWSAFGRGELASGWGNSAGLAASIMTGVRGRF